MTTQEKPYTIVVGIDFSESSDEALDEALKLAAMHNAELHVLYVDDHFRAPEGGREAVEATLTRIEHHGVARIEGLRMHSGKQMLFRRMYSHFRLGAAAEQVVQLASDLNADLVVVGTHGLSGIKRMVLGSVAERVVRLARCPVWIVRPKDHSGLGKVPEIDPPCKDCVATRAATNGATFWCERHLEHHVRAHPYHYEGSEGADRGSSASGSTSTPT
jgi:nucleotide-binding universal stress UspA family protein